MKTTRLPNRSAKSLATFHAAEESGDVRAILETMVPDGPGHMFGCHVVNRSKRGWSFFTRQGLTYETSIDRMLQIVANIPANENG
jgi:hypothetical protein